MTAKKVDVDRSLTVEEKLRKWTTFLRFLVCDQLSEHFCSEAITPLSKSYRLHVREGNAAY